MWWPLLFIPAVATAAAVCAPRQYQGAINNVVCVCNATFCDELERIPTLDEGQAVIIQSSLSGKRFERTFVNFTSVSTGSPSISVDGRNVFQEIIGFGGAFTDSAGINIASLSTATQQKLMESYFSPTGLEYTVGRVPIASTDFSTHVYSYDDTSGDLSLSKFALASEDTQYKIPYIQKALELSGGNMKLFASPWSAPGWMKTTGKMEGPGALKSDPQIHSSYANYFVKFFEEYNKQNVTFWAATIQNEPTSGALPTYGWQTMLFTSFTQRDFVKTYLGPALKKSTVTKDIILITLDDNRLMLPGWADVMFADSYVSSVVGGVGIHWYGDVYTPVFLVAATHDHHPDKFILATEACAGWTGTRGPIMGDWFRAEMYADSIVTDLNNWVAGWTDWNIALDEKGGPNWANNPVDSPIIVNKTSDEFYKQPMFYAMGHFSKFMRPGAKRILSKTSTDAFFLQVVTTSLNGQRVTVILNRTYNEVKNLRIYEVTSPTKALLVDIPAHSITTVVWNKSKL